MQRIVVARSTRILDELGSREIIDEQELPALPDAKLSNTHGHSFSGATTGAAATTLTRRAVTTTVPEISDKW
jgi:hypothetical protein